MSGRVLIDDEAAGDPLLYASNRPGPEVAPLRRALRRRRRADACATRAASARSSSIPTRTASVPTRSTLTLAQLDAALGSRTAPVKAVLMDQARIAGLGNLLVDEALWRAGIDPDASARDLDDDERKRLHQAIRDDAAHARSPRRIAHRRHARRPRTRVVPCPKDGAPLRCAARSAAARPTRARVHQRSESRGDDRKWTCHGSVSGATICGSCDPPTSFS